MKKLTFFIFVLLLFSSPVCFAEFYWDETFGGSNDDQGFDLIINTDGDLVLVGSTKSNELGTSRAYLIKTDAEGNEIWSQTYGGAEFEEISGYSVLETSDDGYLLAGVKSMGGLDDVYLIKVDMYGNSLWTNQYDYYQDSCCCQSNDIGYKAINTSDGGFMICGEMTYNYYCEDVFRNDHGIWLIKIDATGSRIWNKAFGGIEDDFGYDLISTSDGSFLIVGKTNSFGDLSGDFYLVKVDHDGNLLWEKNYGSEGAEVGYSVIETNDNGYIAIGSITSPDNGNTDLWVIKTDPNGNLLWSKTYGGSQDDLGNSVRSTTDNGFIIAGDTKSYGQGSKDAWLLKIDSEGHEDWQKTFGGINSDSAEAVSCAEDGGFFLTGWTSSFGYGENDLWLIYYQPDDLDNQPPYTPTLLSPANGSQLDTEEVTFSWLNNGDPDGDAVGSWLFVVGAWGQVISMDMGSAGFLVGQELSYTIKLYSKQEWAWTIYIYDPLLQSEPPYNYQQPFWSFIIK